MSKTIKVYWAPLTRGQNHLNQDVNWNILFSDPERLVDSLKKDKTSAKENLFQCPAHTEYIKNIFMLKNPIESKFKMTESVITPVSKNFIQAENIRPEVMLKNTYTFIYYLEWIFFTDEPSLKISVTSPYFSKNSFSENISLIPGAFDIGKWFRNTSLEYMVWDQSEEILFEEETPLAYVKFETDKKIDLIRFEMSDKLHEINKITNTSSTWEKKVSLIKRYDRFIKTKTKNIVLKEIYKNIL